jgi:rod shape-determining protein MreD
VKPLRLAVGLGLAVLGTLGLGAARVPATPDLFLLPVADAARGGAPVMAMVAGLCAGLIEDVLSVPGRLLGLHAFTKVLMGYLLATIGTRTVVEKPVAVGGLLAGAVLFENAARFFLLWILRGDALWPSPFLLVTRAAFTGLLGGVLYAASRVNWKARREARRRVRLS